LHSTTEHDWTSTFYQYTNRLAHLYLLRALNEVPAYLVFVYFVNDKEMNGPQSIDEWHGALSPLTSYLGIGSHRLKKYIADIFIDVGMLSIVSSEKNALKSFFDSSYAANRSGNYEMKGFSRIQ